jgi:hypothetical protein
VGLLSLAPKLLRIGFIAGRPKSPARGDLEALLARMRERLYPETIPVLASYWLKTVYASGHKLTWWKDLHEQLKEALREQPLNAPSREALIEIQAEIRQSVLLTGKPPEALPPRLQPFRANLRPEWLAPYTGRLLNEWLSAEVARLLIDESECAMPQDGGIPILAVGRALERLLVRERLSPGTLEMLLQPELLSPLYVYPADAEILRDVVLALLGRTWAPAPPVMPATLLALAAGSALPAQYSEAVRHACYVQRAGGDEVNVPIARAQALEILKGDTVHIGSMIVTMDGRWWESDNLQSGERHSVVYKPGGRLRIDYSADHAKLEAPWPETQLRWPGAVHFRDPVELFGREWVVSRWETDEKRTWLDLTFSRALAIAKIQAATDPHFRRSRPASVDMAWAALENALAASLFQESREPIEQLCRSDLIPLGRAIYGLADSMKRRQLPKRETIETQLRGIGYYEGEVSKLYGRVPWRILPATVRGAFLKKGPDPALLELLNQVFDEFPEMSGQAMSASRVSRQTEHPISPSQAA